MRACPDLLRRDGTLERAWTCAAEEAADARAVAGNPGFALELAQALIRVARLAPRAERPRARQRLLSRWQHRVARPPSPRTGTEPARPVAPLGCVLALTMLGALAGLVVLSAPALHQLMEAAVRALP